MFPEDIVMCAPAMTWKQGLVRRPELTSTVADEAGGAMPALVGPDAQNPSASLDGPTLLLLVWPCGERRPWAPGS